MAINTQVCRITRSEEVKFDYVFLFDDYGKVIALRRTFSDSGNNVPIDADMNVWPWKVVCEEVNNYINRLDKGKVIFSQSVDSDTMEKLKGIMVVLGHLPLCPHFRVIGGSGKSFAEYTLIP